MSNEDFILIESLKRGESFAFERLFTRYAQKLFAFALSYLKNEDDAEEVVQEVFLKVWDRRQELRTDTSFQSYVFTIAFNSIRKTFNKRARENQFKPDIVDQLDAEDSAVDFEHNHQLILDKLEQYINELPERRKLIFLLRKKHGKSLKEIADELDISVKTVENQITEAMRFLKSKFEADFSNGLILFLLTGARLSK